MWTWLKSVFARLTPVVRATLITLLASFVLLALAFQFLPFGKALYGLLALQPEAVVGEGRVWTLVTYALVHSLDSPVHFFFNGLILYFFGPTMEQRWGSKRLLVFMLLTALGGGLFVMATYLLGLGSAGVVGASAVTMGLVIAWGLAYPDQDVWFFFIRMKGIHLVYLSIVWEILNTVSLSGVSAAAHWGGMLTGYLLCDSSPLRRAYLNLRLRQLQGQADALRSRAARRAGPPLRVIPGGQKDPPKDKRWLN